MSQSTESDPQSTLPESAKLLGHNRNVAFYLSEELGLVFVVQGSVVWTLKAVPGASARASADELAFLQGAGPEEPLLGADSAGVIRSSDNPDGFRASSDKNVASDPARGQARRARADLGAAGTPFALFRRMRKRAAGR